MKLGLKTYPLDLERAMSFPDLFDFIELLIPIDFDPKELLQYSFPINIHAAHDKFGYNPADPKQKEINEIIIQKALEAADLTNAEYIVVHPGRSSNKEDESNVLDFFDDKFDKRMLIENCPIGTDKNKFFFSTPLSIKKFLLRYNTSFLFDVGHAIISANNQNKAPTALVEEFSKLNPKVHHVYGTNINSTLTEHHKHFHQVESDYSYLSLLNPDSIFTLETEWVSQSTREDYEKNISFLKSFLDKK